MSMPTEAIEDILSRLPVECLLRFRRVCPLWRDLIDSPYFIELHLNRSIQTENNLNLLLQDRIRYNSLHAAKFEPSILSLDTKELDHHPLRDDRCGIPQVWGSCNGLICLSNGGSIFDFVDGLIPLDDDSRTTIVIWNPSTRRYVTLPYTAFDLEHEEFDTGVRDVGSVCYYGFGYDSVGDDYKVVMLMNLTKMGSCVRVYGIKVYSLKAHSWHSVDVSYNNLPYMRREPGQSAENAFHWIVFLDEDKAGVIVAFDFRTETCQIVPGPGQHLKDTSCIVRSFRDSICVVYEHCLRELADVWVMGEYGVKDSWTKILTLKPKFSRPFYLPKKGEAVFMKHDKNLLWIDTGDGKTCYNMEDGTKYEKVKSIEVHGLKFIENVFTYVESLVPLGRFSKMNDEKKPKEKMNKDMLMLEKLKCIPNILGTGEGVRLSEDSNTINQHEQKRVD